MRANEGSNVEQEIEDTGDAHGRRLSLQKIRVVKKEVNIKVREFLYEGSAIPNEGDSLQERQSSEEDLGRLVSLRLASNEVPEYEDLSSEVTKNREFLSQRVGDVLRQCRDTVIEICRLLDVAKLFHRTINAVLAKTFDEHQRDWDSQLTFAMAAYRTTGYEDTDYSLNFLVLGYEVQVPMDLKYGAPDEGRESFNVIVEVDAFTEVSKTFRRSAKRNRHYNGLSVKAKTFEAGQRVWHFSLRVMPEKYQDFMIQQSRSMVANPKDGPLDIAVIRVDQTRFNTKTDTKALE